MDRPAFIEPPAGEADDRQFCQRSGEETAARAFIEQVLQVEQSPAEAPQRTNDPLGPLGQGGHVAWRFSHVLGRGLELVLGLFCCGHLSRYAGSQITLEDHSCQQRNPVGGRAHAAFPGDGADGEPCCGGTKRSLERDAISQRTREPGCRGRERGAHRYPPNPPVDTPGLRLAGPLFGGRCDFAESAVTDSIEDPGWQAGIQGRLLIDPKPASRVVEHLADHACVDAERARESLVG